MIYKHTVSGRSYGFCDLKEVLAKATPMRSGDVLAGVAATSAEERVAAQFVLANLPLTTFLNEMVIPYETDEVTRLIIDTHHAKAFSKVKHLTVGGFRDWLLSPAASETKLAKLAPGLTPEMAAAVSKIMRLQDLALVGKKCRVVTKFRNTIGLAGRLSTRVQPNHPTDDVRGVAASLFDGLMLGGGDAVIGINPATDSVDACIKLLEMIDHFRQRFEIPTQSCVLAHITTTMLAMQRGAPVDLVFQSIAGSQAANMAFGIDIALIREAREMALSLGRGTVGSDVMYFETGQGSALSANAHHGVDQQTIEARAYAVAREFSPLLVNTVVGFIGPEYLYDGKQIIRAGLEDHFCGKLLGLPMGCDICYTNHAEADQDDMDMLLTMLGVAGCSFIMGVPGADDIMLNYQSTSFHDALYVRQILGKKPAPEFDDWLQRMEIFDGSGQMKTLVSEGFGSPPLLEAMLELGTEPTQMEAASSAVPQSVWNRLREFTPARIGIGSTGVSQLTRSTLEFQQDHAAARDAVYSALNSQGIAEEIEGNGLIAVALKSEAHSRHDYLTRPDWGRRLDAVSIGRLQPFYGDWDIVFVICDGLSATAVNQYASGLIKEILPTVQSMNWKVGPVALVEQGRVAIGDEIAAALGAMMVVVLIGERPGLCSADSMGVYITLNPRIGSMDSERNCISNVRQGGLEITGASRKLSYLVTEGRRLGVTGVGLKEKADTVLSATTPALLNG